MKHPSYVSNPVSYRNSLTKMFCNQYYYEKYTKHILCYKREYFLDFLGICENLDKNKNQLLEIFTNENKKIKNKINLEYFSILPLNTRTNINIKKLLNQYDKNKIEKAMKSIKFSNVLLLIEANIKNLDKSIKIYKEIEKIAKNYNLKSRDNPELMYLNTLFFINIFKTKLKETNNIETSIPKMMNEFNLNNEELVNNLKKVIF